MGREVFKSEQALVLIDHLYTVGENITISVYIKSFRYSGEYSFCLHYKKITEIIFSLELMSRKLQGEVTLKDTGSDSFVLLGYEPKGLFVSGQIGGSHEDNYMVFKFKAEHSLISSLIDKLSESLEKPQNIF